MFCVITTQIFSQFLNWEPVPKCFQSFPSLLVVACMKQVQEDQLPSMLNSSNRRATRGGIRWANSWLLLCLWRKLE